MIKILITGSTGAVGRVMVPYLLNNSDCEILTINRSVSKASDIFGTKEKLIHTSVEDAATIKDFRPEVVIHMASFVSNACDEETGLKLVESNISYGIRVLEIVKQCKSLRLFLNFGTFAEYRSGTGHIDNAYLYSASKTAFRAFAEFYAQSAGFDLVHVVPYTIYGTKDKKKKILDYIYDSFISDQPVKMTPGYQTLDFIHVNDVCRIISRLIVYSDIHSFHLADIYLGTGNGHTIREVAELMGVILNKKPNIEWGGIPYRQRDVMYAVANIGKLMEINCVPLISIEEGLMEFIKNKA
jgi:CDP-paratose synthetase